MTEVRYENSARMAEHLIGRALSRATGADTDLCLFDRPRHRYFVGALATAADMSRPGQEFISRLSPSALGMDVLIQPTGGAAAVLIQPAFTVYYRVLPTLVQQLHAPATSAAAEDDVEEEVSASPDEDEESGLFPTAPSGTRRKQADNSRELVLAYRRVTVCPAPIRIMLTAGLKGRQTLTDQAAVEAVFQQAFSTVVQQLVQDPDRYRGPGSADKSRGLKVPAEALHDEAAFRAFLEKQPACNEIPEWRATVSVEARAAGGGLQRLAIRLQNLQESTDEDRLSRVTDHFLFDCKLQLVTEDARFRPFTFNSLPQDYRYDRRLWGYGQNCSVELPEDEADTDTRRLASAAVPIFRQEKYVTADRVEAKFAELARDPVPVLRLIEQGMLGYRTEWKLHIAQIETAGGEDEETLSARKEDLKGFDDEIRRFQEGVSALEKHPILMRSFKLMNHVFFKSGRPKGYEAWRLFQIVFIVMLIPDVASREPALQGDYPLSRLDTVDVLWFPTGGGKTESYLGITVFTAFFDRLRGKRAGVTAWTRFPLRLLSLQQLQRIADVIATAEMVRRKVTELTDSDPFTVGYLVGQGNTPNSLKAYEVDLTKEFEANPDMMQKYRIVSRCPFCGEKSVRMAVDVKEIRLNHVCTNKACPETVLPIYVVDNEVYRYLPTVVVGTIDKLAAVGNQRKFSQLFGEVTHKCPVHGYGSSGECTQKYGCAKGTKFDPVTLYDPSPTLQIQDELHLLREGLGTFNAHYETWVDQFQQLKTGVRQKIIAATATIENYEYQVRHLYLRPNSRRYPLPGKELGESFYAETKSKIYRRIYVGVMPYNKTHINAVIELLLYFHEEIQTLRKLSTADALARVGLPAMGNDELEALMTNYDVSLTYVSATKEGDRLNQSVESQLSDYLVTRGMIPLRNVEMTGHTQFDEVSRILDELEQPPVKYEERIHAITATSMISHGVDVARLNFMVFFGMPRQTAEYIQSSSRVGRTHVGVAFVCFNPNRARDRSHYHFFRKYHEYLDRLVEPVAINRWSKFSLKRTVPGLFAGYWLNRVYPARRSKIRGNPYFSDTLRKAVLDGVITQDELLTFLGKVYGVDEPEGKEFGQELEVRLEEIFRTALSPRTDMFSESMNPRPMMSLRDVDVPLVIRPDDDSSDLWRLMQTRKAQEG